MILIGGLGDEDAESLAIIPFIVDALRTEDSSHLTDPVAILYRKEVDIDPRNDREALALSAMQIWPEGFPLELGGPGLSDVEIPTLIIHGEEDVPYVYTDQDFAAAIPGSTLIEIPDATHYSVLLDRRFKDEVLDFLENL
jgi:pimeloyl-ACP methyl ester carboxylesterase